MSSSAHFGVSKDVTESPSTESPVVADWEDEHAGSSSGGSLPTDHGTSDSRPAEVEDDGGDHDSSDEDSGDEDDSAWAEDEYPPLELNYEALKHIATHYLSHGKCTDISTLERGSFHEIRILEFEDGWSCIGRFTRNRNEELCVTESEVATVKYVRQYTTIPVPETYFVNLDPTHAVGAPFLLMERMPGIHLWNIWQELSTEQKTSVMAQIADVLAQLAQLKFDKIGSLNTSGTVGPLQNRFVPEHAPQRGPFNTMEEYMLSFMPEGCGMSDDVKPWYEEVRNALHKDLEDQANDPLYNPPFRLIHGDFDAQNMLFTWDDRSEPPKLSGIIDWDYTYTGPLYYLYEYPVFIRDREEMQEQYSANKIVRKNFLCALTQKFPKGSVDREDVRECFRQKSYMYNEFRNLFITNQWSGPSEETYYMREYSEGLKGIGEHLFAYGGREDYEPDSELESDVE